MKNAAFIEWDKKLSSGDQRPRGVFFRQKFASVNRKKLAKQRKAARNNFCAPSLDFINQNYIQAALNKRIPELFVSMPADGSATYTIEDPVTREKVEFNPNEIIDADKAQFIWNAINHDDISQT